jgi:hypothetical protein
MSITLDDAAKGKLAEVLDWTLSEVRELEAETLQRHGAGGEGGTPVTLALALFDAPEASQSCAEDYR